MTTAIKTAVPNAPLFGQDQPQPSSEQKKAGWERRKQAQRMMDMLKDYLDISLEELQAQIEDSKNNPQKYTVLQVMLMKYAHNTLSGRNDKFVFDYLDRNISKAPVEVSGPDGKGLQPQVNIVNFKNVTDEELKKLLSDQTKWEGQNT